MSRKGTEAASGRTRAKGGGGGARGVVAISASVGQRGHDATTLALACFTRSDEPRMRGSSMTQRSIVMRISRPSQEGRADAAPASGSVWGMQLVPNADSIATVRDKIFE